MPRRLAQQRITLSDHEWPFHASRAVSAAAEFLVHTLDTTATEMVVSHWPKCTEMYRFRQFSESSASWVIGYIAPLHTPPHTPCETADLVSGLRYVELTDSGQ